MRGPSIAKTNRARRLRRDATFEEKLLWFHLQNRQCGDFKIVRQEPIASYVADFCCREQKLIIEVDGGQHAESKRDIMRDQTLLKLGYRTIRFTNAQVQFELESVRETILAVLERRLEVPLT